ncbi:MAG: hypothetical protein K0U74_03085 [Alphaproteobacteria bacterium]|nr:hypothetical protein [Alphaproteobacteria bacterium]
MQYLRTIPAMVIALALAGVSIACNYRFGLTLAPGLDGTIYAVLGAVADALKALLPILIVAAWRHREPVRVVVGTATFVVLATYSLTSAFGLYATSRSTSVSDVEIVKVEDQRLASEIESVRRDLDALGINTPPAAIAAQIAAAKHNRRWETSKGCSDATAEASRALCSEIASLEASLATAQRSSKLRERLQVLQSERNGIDVSKVVKAADPQSEALARLTGATQADVRLGLAVLIAVLIELGSGFGLFLATSGTRKPESQPAKVEPVRVEVVAPVAAAQPVASVAVDPVGGVEVSDWIDARVHRSIGGRTQAADLYDDYCGWVRDQGGEPLPQPAFGRELTAAGLARERAGGKSWLVDYAVGNRPTLRIVQ